MQRHVKIPGRGTPIHTRSAVANQPLLDGVEEYLQYQIQMEIFVPASAAAVRSDFRGLSRFLERLGVPQTLASFVPLHVGRYLAEYRSRVKGATLKRWYKSFNGYARWAVAREYLRTNPMDSIRLGWVQTDRREFLLTHSEARRFLSAECNTPLLPAADRALRHLAIFAGLRRNEYLKLRWKHVRWESSEIWIYDSKASRRKGHPDLFDRIIPMCPQLRDTLDVLRTIVPHEPEDPVLVTRHGKPMGKDAFYAAFGAIWRTLGMDAGMVPHCLRHSLAGNMLAVGATHADVALLLGHRNSTLDGRPTTTDGYITSSVARVRSYITAYADLVTGQKAVQGSPDGQPVTALGPGNTGGTHDNAGVLFAAAPPTTSDNCPLSPSAVAEAIIIWRSLFPTSSLTGAEFRQYLKAVCAPSQTSTIDRRAHQ